MLSGSCHHRSTSSISLSASDLKIRCEMVVKLETRCICCSNVGVVVKNGIASIENKPIMWSLVTEMVESCYFWDLNKGTPPLEACFGHIQQRRDTTRGIVFSCLRWPGISQQELEHDGCLEYPKRPVDSMTWSRLMWQPYVLERQGPRHWCQITHKQTDLSVVQWFEPSQQVQKVFSVVTAKKNKTKQLCTFRKESSKDIR